MRFTDGHLVLPLGAKDRIRQDYMQWAASIREYTFLPDYKLKRLWKENFSLEDIKADKHRALWPGRQTRAKLEARGVFRRGPSMRWERVQAKALRAARRDLQETVLLNRLDSVVRGQAERAIEHLAGVIKALEAPATADRGEGRGFSGAALYAGAFEHWFLRVISSGKLPYSNRIVPAGVLFAQAQQAEPRLKGCSATAFGRMLREWQLGKKHQAYGNAWEFGELARHRERWTAINGAVTWEHQGENWLLT